MNFIDFKWFPWTKSVAILVLFVLVPQNPPVVVVDTLKVASPPGSKNLASPTAKLGEAEDEADLLALADGDWEPLGLKDALLLDEADADEEALLLLLPLADALADALALPEALGLWLPEGDSEALPLALPEALGLWLPEGLRDLLSLALALLEADLLAEAEAEAEADIAPIKYLGISKLFCSNHQHKCIGFQVSKMLSLIKGVSSKCTRLVNLWIKEENIFFFIFWMDVG